MICAKKIFLIISNFLVLWRNNTVRTYANIYYYVDKLTREGARAVFRRSCLNRRGRHQIIAGVFDSHHLSVTSNEILGRIDRILLGVSTCLVSNANLSMDKLLCQDIVFPGRIQLIGGARQHLFKGLLELDHLLFHQWDLFRQKFFSLDDAPCLCFSVEGPQLGGKQSSLVSESFVKAIQ